jgi:hypothetical protein
MKTNPPKIGPLITTECNPKVLLESWAKFRGEQTQNQDCGLSLAISSALPGTLHLATAAQLLLATGGQKTRQNVSGAKCCTSVAQMLRQMLHPKCLIINDVAPVAPFLAQQPGRDGLGHGFAFPKALRKAPGGIRMSQSL